MKITYAFVSPYEFNGGHWFYRILMPSDMLRKKGHQIKYWVAGDNLDVAMQNAPDVMVFRGTYTFSPFKLIENLKKRDVLIVYDTDDDYLTVNPSNPVFKDIDVAKDNYIKMIKAADVVTTTTDVLAKRVKKYNKNVKIVPNSLDFNRFKRREGNHERLRIGYTGGSTHWEDLGIVLDVIKDLQDKYDFDFLVQGMCGTPLVGEMYNYKFIESEGLQPEKRSYYLPALETFEKLRKIKYSHIPFYPPELYPDILRTLDIDIGIAPLKDNQFNKAKSCIKMYEYAAVGAAVLTSDVLPYSKENKYTAKNTYKDWYKKLERLIKDEDFRDKVWKKQYDFVEKNVDVSKVVDKWEKVFQGE